ncbi:hypothetical protein SAMN05216490_4922 [Mucilaginibacter mallensis]|uniref:Uncharacterized protein n=1 Tax=Mucilaginibacter mallensis TaxID=652787 RepID=A0A1H2CDP4_MUCMA|nr:hypothetical protein [Mucilaginibacter mallensis]SDT68573.1 hypothetical protein SAMN05216490_4922 [Mucilaginibacter mallensis]
MAASLTKLKGFIQTYAGYTFENIPEPEIEELKNFVADAFQSIRWEVEAEFGQNTDNDAKTQYIVTIQSQLTYLAAGITGFENVTDRPAVISNVFDWVLSGIFKLLEHIRNYFTAYFDDDALLPVGFIKQYKENLKFSREELADNLNSQNVDQDLLILIRTFSEATESSEKFTIKTWRQWEYMRMTTKVIHDFVLTPSQSDINLELLKLLVSREFNSIQVYAYFIRYIEKITLSETTFQEQQQELLYLLKVFRQVRIDAYFLYDPKVQSLKISIVESLEAELTYLEQKEKLLLQNFKNTNPESPSKFYFNFAVTLAELMFFFRIMLEVKLIYTKFNSYLYEFISNHIRTERAENISKKSMRNHFNNKPFPDRTVKNVKGWLEKMINHINLYYNL